ncbi:MAG: hypothetical protein H0V17_10100 [Deltaproteobacteria bacterium]|nr:hypothetical protein [Deltaproteobacteria bacterium]
MAIRPGGDACRASARIGALIAMLAACAGEDPPPPRVKPPIADARPAVPDPPPDPVGDLPVECGLYKALVRKLAGCEQLGPQRGLLETQFETSWKAWSVLPQSERGGIAAGCRAAADAVRAAAAGPCAW